MTELLEPRTLCAPDDKVPHGEHKHLCSNCGTCWKHSDDMPLADHAAFIEGHTCPTCGTEQRMKHITDEPVRLLSAHDLDAYLFRAAELIAAIEAYAMERVINPNKRHIKRFAIGEAGEIDMLIRDANKNPNA